MKMLMCHCGCDARIELTKPNGENVVMEVRYNGHVLSSIVLSPIRVNALMEMLTDLSLELDPNQLDMFPSVSKDECQERRYQHG